MQAVANPMSVTGGAFCRLYAGCVLELLVDGRLQRNPPGLAVKHPAILLVCRCRVPHSLLVVLACRALQQVVGVQAGPQREQANVPAQAHVAQWMPLHPVLSGFRQLPAGRMCSYSRL